MKITENNKEQTNQTIKNNLKKHQFFSLEVLLSSSNAIPYDESQL